MNLKQYLQSDRRQRETKAVGKSHPNKVIDSAFNDWNRFENFLKFASKKEVRDRLREFDAPDLANYIEPETIDKINACKKQPVIITKKKKGVTDESAKKEHETRIQKMKELYGMFVKMDQQQQEEKERS